MAYAHQRGMECVVTATLTEFPRKFAPLLKNPQKVQQLGELCRASSVAQSAGSTDAWLETIWPILT